MTIFLEILKYTLPSIAVFIATWLMLRKYLKNNNLPQAKMASTATNQLLPVRLRAYERLALLLERTKPKAMLLRTDLQAKTNLQLQTELLQTIREEFDHNMSQQIYVSDQAWVLICNARENTIRTINAAAAKVHAGENAIQLAQTIIEVDAAQAITPADAALAFLKNEVKSL